MKFTTILLAFVAAATSLAQMKRVVVPAGQTDNHLVIANATLHAEDRRTQQAREVIVGIGNTRQNIGDWRGVDLYNQIYQAVNTLTTRPGMPTGSNNKVEISTKYIADKPIPGLLRTGKCGIYLEKARFESDRIRRLLIATVADAVSVMPDVKENCFTRKRNPAWLKSVYHCNIASSVSVILPDDSNEIQVRFDFRTDDGAFVCEKTQQPVQDKVQNLIGEWGQVLGLEVYPATDCEGW